MIIIRVKKLSEALRDGTLVEVLVYLIAAEGRVVSRTELFENVWKLPPELETGTVKTHVGRIRGKLKRFEIDSCLDTVHAVGFRWRCSEITSVRGPEDAQ